MNDTFMKERPVLPLLLSMSLPMVISMLVNSLYNIVDSFFVAKISEEAMTALSLVYPIQNFINALSIGFGVGINAVIAFYLGAQDRRNADKAATQGLLLAAVHGSLMTLICIAVIPGFLEGFTSSQAVIDLGVRYSMIAFSFSLIVNISLAFEKFFQAVGRMKVTMAAMMCGCIANIILDPLMIFGIGPFPAMGIEGAALATGIGQTLTLAIYLFICLMRPLGLNIKGCYLKPDSKMILRPVSYTHLDVYKRQAHPWVLVCVYNHNIYRQRPDRFPHSMDRRIHHRRSIRCCLSDRHPVVRQKKSRVKCPDSVTFLILKDLAQQYAMR